MLKLTSCNLRIKSSLAIHMLIARELFLFLIKYLNHNGVIIFILR